MRDFLISKVINLFIPLVLIGYGFFFLTENPQLHWWMLIVATMVFGYVHAIIGFFYQIRALKRAPRARIQFSIFFLLIALSVAVCLFFILNNLVGAFMMFVIVYFTLHGFLNERSLLEMQTGTRLPTVYFLMLALFSTALIYGSLTHPSFFFDGQLVFYSVSESARLFAIEQNLGADPRYVALALFGCTALVFLFTLRYIRSNTKLVLGTTVVMAALLMFFLFFYPLNYLYLFHLYLSYHFIVWSVVFYQKFRRSAPERIPAYVRHHLYVLVPLCITLGIFIAADSGFFDRVGQIVFDARTFLTVSFLHITVSFMNEPWFKKWFV